MTFEELEHILPNGFHDAKIERVAIDYVQRSASVLMQLLTGTPDSVPDVDYRAATLTFTGLGYLVIEPPDPTYPFMRRSAALNVAGYSEDPASFPCDAILADAPVKLTRCRFFVHDWNAFVHVAAEGMELSWIDD
jgi:hypothetical protein